MRAVRRYDSLGTSPDNAFDRVAALAARWFDAPMATVSIVEEDRIWFKAAYGLPEGLRQIGRDPGMGASAILQSAPYTVSDALNDARTADHPLVRGGLGLRFYAAAPIVTSDGCGLGTVDVMDTRPRKASEEGLATLVDLAAVVMDELEVRLSAMRAVQLERELRQTKEANLRAALDSRAGIDQAVGMIMMAHQCAAATAWRVLTGLSQDSNIKVRHLAEAMAQVVSGADPALLDRGLYRTVLRALSRRGRI